MADFTDGGVEARTTAPYGTGNQYVIGVRSTAWSFTSRSEESGIRPAVLAQGQMAAIEILVRPSAEPQSVA
jgi:uncharacterized NAD-dependent epimerase/dehydratase family protein